MERLARQVMLILGLLSWGGSLWGAQDFTEVSSQPDRQPGEGIYQVHCAECHGPSGHGDGPKAALLAPRPGNLVSAATSTKTDEELLAIISRGVPRTAMRGWEGELSDAEQRKVLAYIRSLVHFQAPTQTPSPP